jgi:large subunit ribosomal protein L28
MPDSLKRFQWMPSLLWRIKNRSADRFNGPTITRWARCKNAGTPEITLAMEQGTGIFSALYLETGSRMARICEVTGKGPMKGSIIWRSGKSKKSGGIGTHITAITKRRFFPNLQRVKALVDGEVRYVRVSTTAIKKGLVVKAPKRKWNKGEVAKS